MSDIQELALAAAAFLLASSVFRWNSQNSNPEKAAAASNSNSLIVILTHFMFKECHDFLMANYHGLQGDYYESSEAVQQLSELDHAYPHPTVQRSTPVPRSNEEDHFTYAGSSTSDNENQQPLYSELDHMFELDRKRGEVRQITVQPQSTSVDHFSYAATSADDSEEPNEFDHFEYEKNQTTSTSLTQAAPQSTACDHFSYSASSFEEDAESNDFDHFEYGEHIPTSHTKASSPSTARDHFSYSATSFEERAEPNEFDHFEYEEGQHDASPRIPQAPQSNAKDHFSYSGSCLESELHNEFDHFNYAAQPQPCGAY